MGNTRTSNKNNNTNKKGGTKVNTIHVSTYTFNGSDVLTYECSTKGDKAFSPYYAKVELTFKAGRKETKSIEHWYHTIVKGYASIKEGKGKPGRVIKKDKDGVYQEVRKDFTEQQIEYFGLWGMYFEQNPDELRRAAKLLATGYMFKDSYARSAINQAAAITYHASKYITDELKKQYAITKEYKSTGYDVEDAKAELKKLRTANTKLNNKVKKLQREAKQKK